MGNTNDTVKNMLKYSHLLSPFPDEFNYDSAFFDRIHYYLPGWETPKLKNELITNNYGLISDCLSEYCHELRRYDFGDMIEQYFTLNGSFNKRDDIAVRKTFSGLTKLIFPDRKAGKEELRLILEYAIEGRRRVKEQLKKMAPKEFADTALGYTDDMTGESFVIELIEMKHDIE